MFEIANASPVVCLSGCALYDQFNINMFDLGVSPKALNKAAKVKQTLDSAGLAKVLIFHCCLKAQPNQCFGSPKRKLGPS